MTWCPSTLQAKVERHAREEAAANPIIDLGEASILTRWEGQLPPRVQARPMHRVYLDFTEQPANTPARAAPEDPQTASEVERDAELRNRGLHAAARLARD